MDQKRKCPMCGSGELKQGKMWIYSDFSDQAERDWKRALRNTFPFGPEEIWAFACQSCGAITQCLKPEQIAKLSGDD